MLSLLSVTDLKYKIAAIKVSVNLGGISLQIKKDLG